MANQQVINIGTSPDDGTGDPIRIALIKTNANFSELYSLIGFGTGVSFDNLKDGITYSANQIIMGSTTGSSLSARTLVNGTNITFDVSNNDRLVINSTASLQTDNTPRLIGPLDANLNGIGRVPYPTQEIVTAINNTHNINTTIDYLAVPKIYVDNQLGLYNSISSHIDVSLTSPTAGNILIFNEEPNINIIGISNENSISTIIFAVQATIPYSTNSIIKISGANPVEYNGSHVVIEGTTAYIKIKSPTSAAYVNGGTIKNQTWINSSFKLKSTGALTLDLPATSGQLALTTQQFYIGTTRLALNNAQDPGLKLTGITSIDGYAAGLAKGIVGSIPYQTGINATSFISPNISTTKKVLVQTGDGTNGTIPAWEDLTAIITISNLTGGNNTTLKGAIPYQSDTNITTLLPPNTSITTKYLCQVGDGTNGAAPYWSAFLYSEVAATALSLQGGNNTTLNGAIPYQKDTNITTLLPPNTSTTTKYLCQVGDGTNGTAPVWSDSIICTNFKTKLFSTTTNGNITLDLNNGYTQRIVLTGDLTITLPADPGAVGQTFILIIKCGTYTLSWNTTPAITWLNGASAPTLATGNLVNILHFIWDDIDSRWLGWLLGKES